MALILPSRFTKQPQFAAPLDLANPYGAKIGRSGFAFMPSGFVNNGTVKPLALTTGVVLSAGPSGIALDIASTSAMNGVTVPEGYNFSLQTGGCTLVMLVEGVTAGAGTSQGFVGLVGSSYFGYNTSGVPIIVTGSTTQATSSVGMTPGKLHTLAYTYLRSGPAKIYLDGVLTASVTAPATGIDYLPTLFGHVSAVSTHGRHRIYGAALFSNQILSDAEVIAVSANLFQVFKAPSRKLWLATGGATNAAVNPAAGSIAITGYAPTIAQTANQSITAGAGSIAITGYAPTVTQSSGTGVVPGVGSLALTGYAPVVAQSANQAVSPAAGSLSLTGYAPVVAQSANQAYSPGVGALVITGYAPTVTQASASQSLVPDVGALTITGYPPTVTQSGAGGMAMFFGAGNSRETRKFADLLDKARPTKTAKKRLRRVLEAEALELLPDEPEAIKVASVIAQAVAKKELQAIERRPADAAPLAELPFDPSEEIARMVAEWLENEAIRQQIEDEDEYETELLLMG